MDSRLTGSDELLWIESEKVSLTIKGAASHPDFQGAVIHDDSARLRVACADSFRLDILGDSRPTANAYDIFLTTIPLFYEQQRYEIIIEALTSDKIEFWHENYHIRSKVSRVGRNSQILSGIINFGNDIGLSDLVIRVNGRDYLRITIEVFPSKISYQIDYLEIVSDVTEEIYNLVFDFLKKTYSAFGLNSSSHSSPVEFFAIIRKIYSAFINAADVIIRNPHHQLETRHEIMPGYKAKRTDATSVRWIERHPEYAAITKDGIVVDRIPGVLKQVTYDTRENRLAKYILIATLQRLQDFKSRYANLQRETDDMVIDQLNNMANGINRRLNGYFLSSLDAQQASSGMSLVFTMAPGYRDLYKHYLMLQHGLSITGDVFSISVKDLAVLYEYWCFIKLNSLMRKKYTLVTQNIIKAQGNGLFVSLVKGQGSQVVYRNPNTNEKIVLSYNPKETDLPTVTQRPDNVLSLDKTGSSTKYSYVFDAKYRINPAIEGTEYYSSISRNPGPEISDINTMHRYRDAIVYSVDADVHNPDATTKRTMFGAYVLFPYSDEEQYKQHRFFQSIEKVNIGGLPFLPSATTLVEEMLDDLISDSSESAFERATLPQGIERKLATVDWNRRDVLVGTLRNKQQFQVNFDHRFYHVSTSAINSGRFPIHYIALYEAGTGVQWYGEVETYDTVRRSEITELPKASDELYYRINVKEWIKLDHLIKVKEYAPRRLWYTNLFLLEHAAEVPELTIKSETAYRLHIELKRRLASVTINENDNEQAFAIGSTRILLADGIITAIRDGKQVSSVRIDDFKKSVNAQLKVLIQHLDQK